MSKLTAVALIATTSLAACNATSTSVPTVIGTADVTADSVRAVYNGSSYNFSEAPEGYATANGEIIAYESADVEDAETVFLLNDAGTEEDGALAVVGFETQTATPTFAAAALVSADSEVPTSGSSTYTGAYFGALILVDAERGYRVVGGTAGVASLDANFSTNMVKGRVSDRQFGEFGDPPDPNINMEDLLIKRTKIHSDGSFEINTTGGELYETGEPPSVVTHVDGAGAFGGSNGDYAAGVVVLDHAYDTQAYREFGTLTAER